MFQSGREPRRQTRNLKHTTMYTSFYHRVDAPFYPDGAREGTAL